jgi:hypothetical protein
MLLGPYTGAFVWRGVFSYALDRLFDLQRGNFGAELIPAERGIEVAVDALEMLADISRGEGEKALRKADGILKTIAPYRYASELIENLDQ